MLTRLIRNGIRNKMAPAIHSIRNNDLFRQIITDDIKYIKSG